MRPNRAATNQAPTRNRIETRPPGPGGELAFFGELRHISSGGSWRISLADAGVHSDPVPSGTGPFGRASAGSSTFMPKMVESRGWWTGSFDIPRIVFGGRSPGTVDTSRNRRPGSPLYIGASMWALGRVHCGRLEWSAARLRSELNPRLRRRGDPSPARQPCGCVLVASRPPVAPRSSRSSATCLAIRSSEPRPPGA
jgi:hypothetical protein